MQSPLPSLEAACSSLQQEASHIEILSVSKLNIEISAMYNKGVSHEGGCSVCGRKYHTAEAYFMSLDFLKDILRTRSRANTTLKKKHLQEQIEGGTSLKLTRWWLMFTARMKLDLL